MKKTLHSPAFVVLAAPLVLLTPLAGPYRVMMFKLRTFGSVGTGLLTWAGVLLVYPVFLGANASDGPAACSRLALAIWAYVQMMAEWCGKASRDEGSPHCWFGRWEPAFALGFAWAAAIAYGNGAGIFILAGYACSLAQLGIVRVRRRCEAWTPEDTRRLCEPIQVARLQLAAAQERLTPVAIAWAARASSTLRKGVLVLIPFGGVLFAGAKRLFVRPAAPQGAYKPPTFMGRVMSFVVGHMVFSLITGTLGFWGIAKALGMILAIPAAILLWLLGGKADLPIFAKEDAQDVMSKARDYLDGEKEDVIHRLQQERKAIEARLQAEKEKLSGEIDRRKREMFR